MKGQYRTHIMIAGAVLIVAALATLYYSVGWPEGDKGDHPALPGAMVALELPADAQEFAAITQMREGLVRESIYADFGFIAAYAIFFAIFSLAIVDDRTSGAMLVATLVTAVADVGENIFILRALREDSSPAALRAILIFGSVKWFAFFLIVLTAAVALQEGGVWARLAALSLRTAALVGLFASAASFVSASGRPLVAISFMQAGATFLAILAMYAAAALWPTAEKGMPAVAQEPNAST